jgi:phosphatidate cytidylyltransferase
MLKTRLWMGASLIVLATGVLLFDPSSWHYPLLLLLTLLLAFIGSVELHHLIGAAYGLPAVLSSGAVLLVILANWPVHAWPEWFGGDAWLLILAAFTLVVLLGFVVEMARFGTPSPPTPLPSGETGEKIAPLSPLGRGVGGEGNGPTVVIRLALLTWITAYLGLLPSFLIQLRWLDAGVEQSRDARAALALAIFVPKCCDIGAYFTGRFLGRHPMTPLLSPKKTWEGLLGGLLLSAVVAVAINRPLSVVRGGDLAAAAFGLVVGAVGALGDLAESLVKRACRRKDASQVLPGFGGVLDVIDSLLFAAPIAYCWLRA